MRLAEQIVDELQHLVRCRKEYVRCVEISDVVFSDILPYFVRPDKSKTEQFLTLAEEYNRLLEAAKQFPELRELVKRSRWENR